MTGIERLRELADKYAELGKDHTTIDVVPSGMAMLFSSIANQIEREHVEDCYGMVIDHGTVSRVASDMERHVLGHEGMEDSPVAQWARELRAALGGDERDHADEREAIAWVRKHGGLDMVRRMFRDADSRRVELCGALGIDLDKGWSEAMAAMRLRLMPEGMEWLVEAWPRFEYDAPVRFGDKVPTIQRVSKIDLFSDGSFTLCNGFDSVPFKRGERVKRPAPKVLDADGAEIREKCDVWWICEGDERGVNAERLRVEGQEAGRQVAAQPGARPGVDAGGGPLVRHAARRHVPHGASLATGGLRAPHVPVWQGQEGCVVSDIDWRRKLADGLRIDLDELETVVEEMHAAFPDSRDSAMFLIEDWEGRIRAAIGEETK